MNIKNLNILNVFKSKTFNEKSLTLLVLTLLPAMFVTKSIEATIVYAVLYVIFIIITSLLNKVVDLIGTKETRFVVLVLTYVTVSVLIAQFTEAFNLNFAADYIFLVYLFPISALPYLVRADNETRNIGVTLLDALQSVLIFVAVLLVTALIREVVGTGSLNFGKYINLEFSLNIFPKYAINAFVADYFALIILGFYMALLQFIVNGKKEVTKQWYT